MNLKILKYDLNRHQRIKFGRLESLFYLPICRSCRSNEKSRILRLGEEKINEEINVLRLVKTCRQAESLLKIFKLDKNVFLARNKSNQLRLDQRGIIPEAKVWKDGDDLPRMLNVLLMKNIGLSEKTLDVFQQQCEI